MKEENKKRRSTFAVLFYLNRSKIKKNGLCPVMGRISIDAQTAVFSCKTDADPKLWDAKNGRMAGKSRHATEVNRIIDKFAAEIEQHYNETSYREGYVTAELVKNALNGIGKKQEMLLKLFAEHNEEYKLRVGVNRTQHSYYAYTLSCRHLSEFIKQHYGTDDYPLKKLDLNFIDAYDFYLRVDKHIGKHAVSNHIITLKKMSKRAVNQGILKRDPFMTYLAEQPEKKCRHLTAEEIDKVMRLEIKSKQVRHTRDMFVFSCFSGLAYTDLKNLSEKHLVKGKNGSFWIKINRQKTKSECNIRLLDIPKLIIKKYEKERKSDRIFNIITLASMCRNLKKIAKMCGIERITFHMARHNFGTQITLSQGVPIETVSRMMGHQSIATTQLYAHITNQKLNDDMKQLSGRITDKYEVFEDKTMPVGIKLNQNFKRNEG